MNGYSQIDTTILSYYPLHNGNYWEYEELMEQLPPLYPHTSTKYYSIKIIGDTTLSNLKKYKKIRINGDNYSYFHYERIDTLTYNVFRHLHSAPGNEYLIDSLRAEAGDTLRASRTGYNSTQNGSICFNTSTDTILGIMTTIKKFRQLFPSFAAYIHHLSAGFGLCYLERYGLYEKFSSKLKYAKIDGVEFGSPVITGINVFQNQINSFQLGQNFPNPFNSTTYIPFDISQKSKVEIIVYDINGRKINTLLSKEFSRGSHRTTWDGTNQTGQSVASGVYIYLLKSTSANNSIHKSKKLLLLR